MQEETKPEQKQDGVIQVVDNKIASVLDDIETSKMGKQITLMIKEINNRDLELVA